MTGSEVTVRSEVLKALAKSNVWVVTVGMEPVPGTVHASGQNHAGIFLLL